MKTLLKTVTGLLFLSALLVSCAKAPEEDLTAAQTALTAAAEAGADMYVSDLYQAAQDSLAAAQVEIEAQNAKGSFSRNYGRAAALLASAQQTAAEAQAQVETKKEEMRVANESLIAEVEQALAKTTELLTKAPRGKDGAAALAMIQQDAAAAAQTLDEARAAHAAGEFARAGDLATAALDKANGLISELETAIAKGR
jgi:hypothetical protein